MRPKAPAHAQAIPIRKKHLAERAGNKKFNYICAHHKTLPHVIKFSGGRSSGMLLFTLLNHRLLDAGRGDVVVFNNTSAEHPATYEFVRKCKSECEKQDIPFFWTEFQTYEDAARGIYKRLPSYRLVNQYPHATDNPNGYHWQGEVFKEVISWSGFVPSRDKRICTKWMKLFVSGEFLKDWFACKESISRLGHYGETSRIVADDTYTAHLRAGGATPKKIFLEKRQFCWSRPPHRPAGLYADFSSVANYQKINNAELSGKNIGGRVNFCGEDAVDYCSFIGFRGDEPHRVAKMRNRQNNDGNTSEENEHDSYLSTPEGEHVYLPLVQLGVSKADVAKFWEAQKWNLNLPLDANLSNCTYCFLKGSNSLWHLANRQNAVNRKLPPGLRSKKHTPSDIEWWVQLEEEYGRDLQAEERRVSNEKLTANGGNPVIGFFDVTNKMTYRHILEQSQKFKNQKTRGKKRNVFLSEFQNLPCDCTD